jgi:hypothetical protein
MDEDSGPIGIQIQLDGRRVPISLEYDLTINASIQGVSLEARLRPDGIELGLRGGLSSTQLIRMLEALHKTGKTRLLADIMTSYPIKLRLMGFIIRIPPLPKRGKS